MSQCTQGNFLAALEKFRAPIIGFANEDLSQTQVFNCHKLQKFNVGKPLSLEDFNHDDPSETLLINTINSLVDPSSSILPDLHNNVTFFGRLLAEDERLSRMDLEYWVDYMQLFGPGDMIPLYDHMNPITYRNWDVYIFLTCVFSTIAFINYNIFKCIKGCIFQDMLWKERFKD